MRRGHVALLVLIIVASLGVMVTVLSARLSLGSEHHRAHDERLQLLWAVRSAALTGVSGTRQLQTSIGAVTVKQSRASGLTRWTATSGDGAEATLTVKGNAADPDAWDERFQTGARQPSP